MGRPKLGHQRTGAKGAASRRAAGLRPGAQEAHLLDGRGPNDGRLLHVLALTPHWRAIARARWKAALSWVFSRRKFMRKLHVGDKAIRRAAKRIYFYSSSTPTPSVVVS